MDQIWTPWRMSYIEQHDTPKDCIFCAAVQQEDGPVNLVLFRGQHSFVILNRYPYTNGHLMIVPFDHQGSLNGLIPAARAEMMELSSLAVEVLREIYHTDAFNLGINLGSAAGAGVVGHVHIHVVPRWGGDTNFMTTLANTRVIPEVLEDTYARVTLEWYKRLNLPGSG